MRLFISEDFPPHDGGLSSWAYHLSSSLNDLQGDVLVIARNYSQQDRVLDRRFNFPVWRMAGPHWRRLRYVYMVYYLFKYFFIQGARPVIYATRWKEGLVPALLAPLLRLKVIVAAHGNDVIKTLSPYRSRLFRLTFQRSHVGVAVSRYTAKVLLQMGIPAEKVIVIPNGVDTELFHPQERSYPLIQRYGLQGKKVLLTLARLVPRKGQDQVIRALPEIIRTIPDVVYLVAGRGDYEKKLKDLARSTGVQDRVIFTGFISPEEIVAHYNLADVYIMPSREIAEAGSVEGFGITYLEANACRIPVIGGRSGGVSDAIVDGETGLLVDPNDVDAIAAAVIRLLSDPAVARKMGDNGRERVLRTLQWRHIATRFLEAERKRT
jgi:phosphatidylinositol alpha-1,6-mannosyltransferase